MAGEEWIRSTPHPAAGSESHTMHKGDVLHTSTNTPHQMTVPAGKTFVY